MSPVIDALWSLDFPFLQELRKLHPTTPILCFGDALLESANAKSVLQFADGIINSPLTFFVNDLTDWSRSSIASNGEYAGIRTTEVRGKISKASVQGRSLKPRHELFLHARYRWPFNTYLRYTTITTSWGCPYSMLIFCTATNLPSIFRPADEIIAEMKVLRTWN